MVFSAIRSFLSLSLFHEFVFRSLKKKLSVVCRERERERNQSIFSSSIWTAPGGHEAKELIMLMEQELAKATGKGTFSFGTYCAAQTRTSKPLQEQSPPCLFLGRCASPPPSPVFIPLSLSLSRFKRAVLFRPRLIFLFFLTFSSHFKWVWACQCVPSTWCSSGGGQALLVRSLRVVAMSSPPCCFVLLHLFLVSLDFF